MPCFISSKAPHGVLWDWQRRHPWDRSASCCGQTSRVYRSTKSSSGAFHAGVPSHHDGLVEHPLCQAWLGSAYVAGVAPNRCCGRQSSALGPQSSLLNGEGNVITLGEHSGFESVTVLFNELGGLQVRSADMAGWNYVKPQKNMAVVNLGDAVAKLSNDKLVR